jgi:hypothetical protein
MPIDFAAVLYQSVVLSCTVLRERIAVLFKFLERIRLPVFFVGTELLPHYVREAYHTDRPAI